jgi:hypothetical protein
MSLDASVGQVDLVLVPGAGFGRLGWCAAHLLARVLLLGIALGEPRLVASVLLSMASYGPVFDLGFGSGNRGKALFTTRQLFWDIQPVRQIGLVRGFCLAQQCFHLGRELLFQLIGMLSTQGPVWGGVDLGAVKTDGALL